MGKNYSEQDWYKEACKRGVYISDVFLGFREVPHNLFNNACSAMEDGGHLDIRIRPKDINNVLVTVADNGCGIPKEDLERVFDLFFSTKTKTGGTGLGLTLTANFLREMGGKITVESEPGEGTTFAITLPLKMMTS